MNKNLKSTAYICLMSIGLYDCLSARQVEKLVLNDNKNKEKKKLKYSSK